MNKQIELSVQGMMIKFVFYTIGYVILYGLLTKWRIFYEVRKIIAGNIVKREKLL